jgi:hypothetical protein
MTISMIIQVGKQSNAVRFQLLTNFMQQNSFQKLIFAHLVKKLPTFYVYRSSIFLDITPCSLVKVN